LNKMRILRFLCFVWLPLVNGQLSTSTTEVVELGVDSKGENFFDVLPNQAPLKSLDFSICFRCRFWTWKLMVVFKSSVMGFLVRDTEHNQLSFTMSGTSAAFPMNGLKISPTLWNSICIVHNSELSILTLAINGHVNISSFNETGLNKEDLLKTMTIGDSPGYSGFEGQMTDFNFWSKALSPSDISAFVTECSDKLFERWVKHCYHLRH